jgi:SAM-dependent methyltransferase
MQRKYYEAYDDRYRQIHSQNLKWFDESPSAIVLETIHGFVITKENELLELGCGEGRDAFPLLQAGFRLLATDISPEAIRFCREKHPEYKENFAVLDCVAGKCGQQFDFIYAVAVVHMLVDDGDRNAFYTFICDHLPPNGIALICTMGDGVMERSSDTQTAFDLQERIHEQSGKVVQIAGTSCRMVSFSAFRKELKANNLAIVKEGITSVEPDFSTMMYAVVRRES